MEISKTKLTIYSSLGNRKMRQKHGLFLIEGEKSIADTLTEFEAECLLVKKGHTPAFATDGLNLVEATEQQMAKVSNLTTPPDMIAVYRLPGETTSSLKVDPGQLYLLLDGVQDPGNLGTIVRTCHWFGIFRIFASKDTVDLFNPKTLQSTMGSVARVKVTYCDLKELILSNKAMPVYGTLLEGRNIFKTKLSENGFVIMGNEGKGISPEIKKLITQPLNIPPYSSDHSESLNVAIATAITLAEFRR